MRGEKQNLFKADFHIHSEHSMDCSMSLEQIIKRCQETGINCIAIADHGTTDGALKMQTLAPFPVIVAEEIMTPHGEIMGMFLRETIPSGLSVGETIARIKAQGGLVCIPHPFDLFRGGSALNSRVLESIVEQIDIIEIFNARTPLLKTLEEVQAFAEKHGLPGSVGSDSHIPAEIGNAYMEMPEFQGKEDFLQALAQGKIFGNRTNLLARLGSLWARLKK